jgi:hypothetical protein
MITPIASMSAPSLAAPGARVALTAPRKSGIQAPRQYWLEPVVTWVTVSVRGDGWPDGDPTTSWCCRCWRVLCPLGDMWP